LHENISEERECCALDGSEVSDLSMWCMWLSRASTAGCQQFVQFVHCPTCKALCPLLMATVCCCTVPWYYWCAMWYEHCASGDTPNVNSVFPNQIHEKDCMRSKQFLSLSNFPTFMGIEGSLPCWHEPDTSPYPGPH